MLFSRKGKTTTMTNPSRNAPLFVDFDDILCETARGLCAPLNRAFDRNVAFDDIHHFDLDRSFDLSPEQAARLGDFFHDPDLLGAFEPVPQAAATLQWWVAQGGEIEIVTGRPPSTVDVSKAWLARHHVPAHAVYFVDKFGRWGGHTPGVDTLTLDQICARPYVAAIEDSPHMIGVLRERMQTPVIVLDRPWNRALPAGRPYTRHLDWASIRTQLSELAGAL
jgi:uncharacterized HAD superfamily protein